MSALNMLRFISSPLKNGIYTAHLRSVRSISKLSQMVLNQKQNPENSMIFNKNNMQMNYNYNQKASLASHNHTKLWTIERYLSAGLLGLIPASFILPLPGMDYALALALVIHVHWGVEAIVVDYIRPALFGPIIPKVSLILMYVLSIATLGGLFYFNYTDVGMVNAIRMIGKI